MQVVAVLVTIAASAGCDALFRVDNVAPSDAARGSDGSGSDGGGGGDAAQMSVCLDDRFNGTAIDAMTWTLAQAPGYGIDLSEGGGVLAVAIAANFAGNNGIYSRNKYDMTGGYAMVQLVSANLASSISTGLNVQLDSSNYFEIDVLNNELLFTTVVAGNLIDNSVAAVPVLPVYLRIHHDNGMRPSITFDSSTDASTWNPLHTEGVPLPVDQLHVTVYGYSPTTSDPASTSQFANLRLVGPNCP